MSVRRVRYQVAASLDGFLAGPAGQIDWISAEEDDPRRLRYLRHRVYPKSGMALIEYAVGRP